MSFWSNTSVWKRCVEPFLSPASSSNARLVLSHPTQGGDEKEKGNDESSRVAGPRGGGDGGSGPPTGREDAVRGSEAPLPDSNARGEGKDESAQVSGPAIIDPAGLIADSHKRMISLLEKHQDHKEDKKGYLTAVMLELITSLPPSMPFLNFAALQDAWNAGIYSK